MALEATYVKKSFTFTFDARTSRGKMKEKVSWFIKVWDVENPSIVGFGECGPLPGLSIDDRPDFEKTLSDVVKNLREVETTTPFEIATRIAPVGFPSIRFAVETALLDLMNGGSRVLYPDCSFIRGEPVPINGLVWMGEFDFMLRQVHKKVGEGFTCIKIKVGGLDFNEECRLLETIRQYYPSDQITLRLDANGAFSANEAMRKLERLSAFDIHSIEQPIRQGQIQLKDICKQSPIAIALDEELIGRELDKLSLLEEIRPSYIILKPTLHGGLHHCAEWIQIAESIKIGWWITSALESNVGLNAICQFTSNYASSLPQGLGTGSLYLNNFESPLDARDGNINYRKGVQWNLSGL